MKIISNYKPQEIEAKWQKKWEESGLYEAVDLAKKPKKYLLIEFPYPSGERLHVGHGRSYCALDALARYYRMKGFNVLYPLGWDAFGLPAENYAIKTGINPAITTSENIKNAKKQAKSWGLSFDWSREINTTDPNYYQWTQWIFLKMLEHGLAYRDEVSVNWCPTCKTNLADEEVLADGTHERCGKMTEKRKQKQWLLRITKYADRLLEDLKTVDYLPKIRIQQENWIGRKEGREIDFEITTVADENFDGRSAEVGYRKFFPVQNLSRTRSARFVPQKFDTLPADLRTIKIFTTRPETIEGAAFVVLSPNHPLAHKIKTVLNPATKKEIPVYVDEYVLDSVGTGAIMGVPAYDERDRCFAKEHHLPVVKAKFTEKIYGKKATIYHLRDWVFSRQHYWGEPIPVVYCANCAKIKKGRHPEFSSGSPSSNSSEEMLKQVQHDVIISNLDGVDYAVVPVPYDQLPVKLPYVEKYEPTGTGESPLADVKDWVETICPKCGGPAKRETDTMPNWAGSNWYYIGYLIAKKLKKWEVGSEKLETEVGSGKLEKSKVQDIPFQNPASHFSRLTSVENENIFSNNKELLNYWLPVDLYNGGMEHTTLHLLYSRFIYKFLSDIRVVPGIEPYQRRHSHGTVLGSDGQKMSKSRGNVINPDEIIKTAGADTFRLYEMFMGPFEQTVSWSEEGMMGCSRFLKRVWQMVHTKTKDFKTPQNLQISLQKTIKKAGEDLENLKFNTAVAGLMEFINLWAKPGMFLSKKDVAVFLQILAPFAPHISEELWQKLNGRESLKVARAIFSGTNCLRSSKIGDLPAIRSRKWSIHQSSWPKYSEVAIADKEATMIVEVNGRVRDKLIFNFQFSIFKSKVEKIARASRKVQKYLNGKKVKHVIFVPGKLINFVVE